MNTEDLLKEGFIGSPAADDPIWDWTCPTCSERHIQLWQARQNEHYGRRPLMEHPEKRNLNKLALEVEYDMPSLHLSRGQFETAILKLHIEGKVTLEEWRLCLTQLVR